MSTLVVVGAQWGDEGKGKVTDYLSARADMVVRYQGGNNAGHTVVVGDQEYRMRLIPSGIFHRKACVIGNGVVLDPAVLVQELDYLTERGVSTEHLRVSGAAHLILPYHIRLDELEEDRRGALRLGTTRRGIGPAYADKSARIGIRVSEYLDGSIFAEKLRRNLEEKNRALSVLHGAPGFDFDAVFDEYQAYAWRIRPLVADTSLLINQAIDRGENVLFEGAQGTLLDLDHGTYPYVTSSHPVAGGACIGAGVGPTRIDRVLGTVKAYTTRVGDGPFPSELTGREGEWIRERGREYGTVTGRPRRCGWLDTVIIRYAARVSGLTHLALTRLDTLAGLDRVRICVAYRRGGEHITDFPQELTCLEACEPIYVDLPGWPAFGEADSLADLPREARVYLDEIAERCRLPIALVSLGRERGQTLAITDVFAPSPTCGNRAVRI
ncbi:MAG TPA: adenylosuccinate synthase [Clostridiales bacterium]|nr:adenylosuccinate synthase [Clostridiales bacterium]